MKSIKAKRNNRKLIIILSAVVIVALSVLAYFYYTKSQEKESDPTTENTSMQEKPNNGTPLDESDTSDKATSNIDEQQPEQETTQPPKEYISSPNRPVDKGEKYPIETQHFRIDKNSSTDYKITLYPLVNSPDPKAYDQELRDYKNESLDYLKNRYGNISNFNIKWVPERANSV